MKKLLILFLVILMAGCSAKTLKWEDVKESYAEMENASTTIAKPEAYLKSDYLMIFDQIKEELTSLVKGVEKDAEDNVRTLYQNAVNLEWIVSDKDNEGINTFKDLCYGLKKIVEAAYMKSEDFDTLKNSLLEQVDAIRGWNDEQWAQVEIRATLKYHLSPPGEQLVDDPGDGGLVAGDGGGGDDDAVPRPHVHLLVLGKGHAVEG